MGNVLYFLLQVIEEKNIANILDSKQILTNKEKIIFVSLAQQYFGRITASAHPPFNGNTCKSELRFVKIKKKIAIILEKL